MPRTSVPVVQITLAGITPSATDGAAGDVANGNVVLGNDGESLFIAVANSGAAAYEVTFSTPGTVGAEAYAVGDKVESLAAGAKEWFGPFPLAEFTRELQVNVANAALKLQAFRI